MTQKEDIKNAIDAMKKGGVILYPTDTVWGLGCDATNAEAVAKIYKIKQRDDSYRRCIRRRRPGRWRLRRRRRLFRGRLRRRRRRKLVDI